MSSPSEQAPREERILERVLRRAESGKRQSRREASSAIGERLSGRQWRKLRKEARRQGLEL